MAKDKEMAKVMKIFALNPRMRPTVLLPKLAAKVAGDRNILIIQIISIG
jgi:hypothetical protein